MERLVRRVTAPEGRVRAERARTRASALVSGELVETCWRVWAHALGTLARTPGLGERDTLPKPGPQHTPLLRPWWEKWPEGLF